MHVSFKPILRAKDSKILVSYALLIRESLVQTLKNSGESSNVDVFELIISSVQFSSVQSLSHVLLFATPRITACQASLSITSPGVHPDSRPSSHLILCHPLLLLLPIPPSIRKPLYLIPLSKNLNI